MARLINLLARPGSSAFLAHLLLTLSAAILLGCAVVTWASFRPVPERCEVSGLLVSATVAGKTVPVEFPLKQAIEIGPGAPVTIQAQIQTFPDPCDNQALTVNWLLSFTSNPSRMQIVSESPTRHWLELAAGPQPLDELEEDQIAVTVLNGGRAEKMELIRLKIKQGE